MIVIEISDGLGNQMFQYAFAMSLAKIHDDQVFISKRLFKNEKLREYGLDRFELNSSIKYIDDYPMRNIEHLLKFNGFKIQSKFNLKNFPLNVFSSFGNRNLYEVPYVAGKTNIYMGSYQSEKFFSNYSEEIKKDFKIKNIRPEIESIGEKVSKENSICVHIRRGDYLKSRLHCVCKEEYYREAIAVMREKLPNAVFYAFSDDIDWVKGAFPDLLFNNVSRSMYEDIYLMSKCNHFIISNSTFSWWAQYLSSNTDKIVVAPSRWLNNESVEKDPIYQSNWTLIEV